MSADSTLVAPRISGTISQVLVADNQQVKAGQVLAVIDDGDYRNAVLSAQANLETASAQLLSLPPNWPSSSKPSCKPRHR
ncbi:multidrug resistance protein MdtN [Ewingella americana]|uniref:Multidrug resistance protein MdtN n=1 Tax=Ewingella americana TaxID=41202 RepID=A0A377NB84_9GAMM|nr:multidrug resistance protein MdtN [Ewingella americana]